MTLQNTLTGPVRAGFDVSGVPDPAIGPIWGAGGKSQGSGLGRAQTLSMTMTAAVSATRARKTCGESPA
jgi:hypothetical protein